MNFNPSEEEINFVNDALRMFNDENIADRGLVHSCLQPSDIPGDKK
jgi:hypothetical protein